MLVSADVSFYPYEILSHKCILRNFPNYDPICLGYIYWRDEEEKTKFGKKTTMNKQPLYVSALLILLNGYIFYVAQVGTKVFFHSSILNT